MTNTQEKTVLITGASRGIGRALADEYVQAGAHVLAVARKPGDDDTGGAVDWIAADLAVAEGWDAVIDAVAASGRILDVVVNNAGIQQAIDLGDTGAEDFRGMAISEIAINLTAPLVLAGLLLGEHIALPMIVVTALVVCCVAGARRFA